VQTTNDLAENVVLDFDKNQLRGLSIQEVKKLQQDFGLNVLQEEKTTGPLLIFLLQFHNPMVYVLLIAVIISFLMGETLNSFAILSIILLNSVIGFIQERKAESSMDALKKLSLPKARVRRDGKVTLIDSTEVVPGDLLILEAGDYIMADAKILKASQLSVDESVLTGESAPVSKEVGQESEHLPLAERKSKLHAGTAVNTGSALAIVMSTGMKTELGKIAGLLIKTKNVQTPLQKKMNHVSYRLLLLGGAVMIAILVIGFIRGDSFLSIFMYAISLAVAAIPEGLPTVVTLALALAVNRMSKRNAIIRKMSAVETLGSVDIICSDKTGTLTTGKMVVREIFTLKDGVVEGKSVDSLDFYKAAILCNNASLDHEGSGDSTEVALLMMARDHKQNAVEINRENKRLQEFSFDSDRKRMSVVTVSESQKVLFCKGAPESILSLCKLDSTSLEIIQKRVTELSRKGRRILALSYKMVQEVKDQEENNLEFLGLVSLADPPREESREALASCKAAGIKVIMITGDHPNTAEAIAKEIGIIESDEPGFVLSGKELDEMSVEKLMAESEKVSVYARVTSEHKLKIIEALQMRGSLVAMTGDGVNDAPALKQADIGISMGRVGTEVARQASDMVLIDDNFSTIGKAIEEGRSVHGNIKRTIQYLLSTNMAELCIVFATIIFGFPNPFVPISLLWINIITDGLPSIALSIEPVRKKFLATSSKPSAKDFFDKRFIIEMISVALLMTILVISVYYYTLNMSTKLMAKSYVFNLLVYLTLFRSFTCRSDVRSYFSLKLNPLHLAAVFIPICMQIILQYNEDFLTLFRISKLSLTQHGMLIVLSIIPVLIVEIYKLKNRESSNVPAIVGVD
jgi:P-type Ca2+ transporter type 2C